MKCPKCQTENPGDRKFCRECGVRLLLPCPRCGFENIPGDKFCGECGHQLSLPSAPPPQELSFDEKLAKIQRYLPQGLTEKILAQKGKIEGERRQVTVMFCDMEGFVPLSEKIGHEEIYTLMDQVYEILIHQVHGYEGTVNKLTGDGIMALFGAPIALEDAPQRAISSSLAIHREMARFGERIGQERGIPPLRMRIGIHTGSVVVGTLGNNLRVEFTAVGDTVNLASRMEALAEPGTTWVSEDTFRLAEGFFRFESLGERKVKGKEAPIGVYRVIAPSTWRTRFDVSAERGLTPFVGKKRELELLVDGLEQAKAGRGQAFSIVADAGVGKSRLLYEFKKAVAKEDITFLEGRCLSYSRVEVYHPIIGILKSLFDIREEDKPSEVTGKVKKGLETLQLDEGFVLPYLLELLSVKDGGIDKIPMSPQARKDRIIQTVTQITLKVSEVHPLVMAVEDLHWLDKSSEDALKYFLDSIPRARVLLIFTYRPEFVHIWGGKSYHSQINLNRLSNRESLVMAAHLLGIEEIGGDLEALILEKTEGIPFFIEEFIKSLKDLKIIEKRGNKFRLAKNIQAVVVSSTIYDVIMARVDSLPQGAKEVLQTGSVIEREFSYELIRRVTGLASEELLSHLSVLRESELLYERGIFPFSTYIFKHALTREVVYDSILTKKKEKLHEEIGKAIEETYPANLEAYYGALAEHFMASGNFEKAAVYSEHAYRKAEKSASFTDAIAYAKKQVASLERLPQTEEVQKRIIDARTALGLYMFLMNYMSEAKETIDPIIDLALQRAEKRRLSQIHTILGAYHYMVKEDLPRAFKHLEEALKTSQEIEDMVSFLFASNLFGLALSWNCEFEKALYHIGKAIDILKAMNLLWLVSVMKSNLSVYGYNYQGRVNLGYQTSEEAVRIAEESGDILSKSMAYTSHGISCFYRGLLAEAEKYLLQGAAFSERTNLFSYLALAHQWLGHTYFEMEKYGKSKDSYGQAIYLREQSGLFPSSMNLNKIAVARVQALNREKEIDFASLKRYVSENKVKLHDGPMARYISEVLLHTGGEYLKDAGSWIQQAMETDRQNGLMWDLGRDYAVYAALWKRKGGRSKAKENLDKAREIFRECGAEGWAEKAERTLSQL